MFRYNLLKRLKRLFVEAIDLLSRCGQGGRPEGRRVGREGVSVHAGRRRPCCSRSWKCSCWRREGLNDRGAAAGAGGAGAGARVIGVAEDRGGVKGERDGEVRGGSGRGSGAVSAGRAEGVRKKIKNGAA
jgi:hypothetical protein